PRLERGRYGRRGAERAPADRDHRRVLRRHRQAGPLAAAAAGDGEGDPEGIDDRAKTWWSGPPAPPPEASSCTKGAVLTYKRKAGLAGVLVAVLGIGFALAAGAFGRASHPALAVEVHVTFTDKSLAVAPGKLNSQLASFDAAIVIVNKGKKPH